MKNQKISKKPYKSSIKVDKNTNLNNVQVSETLTGRCHVSIANLHIHVSLANLHDMCSYFNGKLSRHVFMCY